MAVINILSPHVADMIAAGEVVERPASVIKELMENSFDAGAKSVTVEIKGGGAPFIRVTDDGLRHGARGRGVAFLAATPPRSSMTSTGLKPSARWAFRGEALAAISAVSEVELTTRRRGDDEGTFVTLTAGDIQDMGPAGCPEGTVMAVKGLFYNTPARLKFLKSDRSEASACVQTALRCALGRPEISVRFIRDGKEEFFSPGDGRAESAGVLPARARYRKGHAALLLRGRGAARPRLHLVSRRLPRQPQRAVFLLQRPVYPLFASSGRGRAGV